MSWKVLSLSLVAVLAGCKKPPVAASGDADPLAAPLPVDPGVRQGAFDNGLRWFVEVNGEPDDRAVLRLVVDVGSVLEDDDQLGLAHFVEHMAFNGTTHFPGNALITYLEGVGTRFGPHLNAHTSFDETVYKLTVPTDDPETFEKAFLVLEDWAHGLTFDDAEIEKERGVVLEEWRTRLGAQGRILEKTVPLTYWSSPYASRLPIGTEESLKTFAPDALRRFYADWYRPDRMAVIAVGDFDPDRVQALIAEHFGDLPSPEAPRERVVYEVPDHPEPLYAVVADPEVTRVGVTILAKHDDVERATHRSYRDDLVEQLAFQVINERLGELARQADPPFLGAGAGRQRLTPTEGGQSLGAGVTEQGLLRGYEALLVELRRVRTHGFRAAEVERARARVLKGYDSLLLEKDKTDSTTHASEIVRVFTTGESMPGTAYEVELARRYVPEITLEELQAWAHAWMPERSRVVTVVMPDKPGLPVPTEAELRAIDARVATMEIPPLPDEEALPELLASWPAPGSVTATDDRWAADLGFTGWTLSNGVRVWFRKTDFKQDEVRFTAWSDGGLSKVSDADYVAARTANDILYRSGYGQLDANQLSRWSAGRTLGMSIGLSDTWETISGSASPADLEALLQLVHAAVTAPRFSEEALALAREQQRAALANRDADPNTAFQDAWTRLVWPDDPRRQPWTVETLAQMDLERSRAVYADRFADVGDFTFVFVGNLPEGFEDLVERTLATLPAAGRQETWTDRGTRPKMGRQSETVRQGLDPKARVRIDWHGPLKDNTWETRNQLYAMADVLSVLLREELREERGGVYGVSVGASEEYRPDDRYRVRVEFQCDPERVEELKAATEAVVARLREQGPEARYVEQEKEKNRRSREEDLRSNAFWLSSFSGALMRQADPREILTWDARNDALSPALIQQAARAWLRDQDRVDVVLLPATSDTQQ